MLKFQEQSGITPKALESKPELPEHLVFHWQLFYELSDERVYSAEGTANSLKLSDFMHYVSLYQFTRQDAQDAWEFVRLVDGLWMEEWRKRQKSKAGSEKSVPKVGKN